MMVKQFAKSLLPSRLWGLLQTLRLRFARVAYRSRTIRRTYGGHPLTIRLADPLAEAWYDHDWPELGEISLLKTHGLREGVRVFDLGAHQGVVALMLARVVGPRGRVLAVEANSHNAAVARENRDLNGAAQLEVLHAAVAESSGELLVNESLNAQVDDGSRHFSPVRVPSFSIDDLARRHGRPDVLFIDVEGYECRALRGAAETLAAGPDCYVEVHCGEGLEKFGGSVQEIFSYFPEDRYESWVETLAERSRGFHPASQAQGLGSRGLFRLVACRKNA